MKLFPFFFAALTASTVLAETPKEPSFLPAPGKAELRQSLRASLLGKWMVRDGDQWEFAATGSCSRTSEPAKAEMTGQPVKVQGTFTIAEDLRLEVKFEGYPGEIFEINAAPGKWSLKPRAGEVLVLTALGKKEMATQILEDLRLVAAALDQWAIENSQIAGARALPADLQGYLKVGTRMFYMLGNPAGPHDLLGNPLGPLILGKPPKVPPATQQFLSDVAPPEFWGPFAN